MKTLMGFVLAVVLLAAPVATAQRNHGSRSGDHGSRNSGGENHTQRNGGRSDRGDGHFNRDRHGRIDRNRDVRIVEGRRQIFFDGFWFGCDVWPEWVLEGDVYVVVINDGYVMYDYSNPSLFISINIVP